MQAKSEVNELLKKYTKCSHIILTSKGDAAILAALKLVKKLTGKNIVLIPDQGGWISYKKIPKKLGFEIKEVKTDYGLIDLNDLKSKAADAACFLYENPGGYIIEEPIKEIHEACKGKCLVVLDVAGSISTEGCNGNYADILVGSFGEWKPINLHYGGFIGFKENYLNLIEIPKEDMFDEKYYAGLLAKIQNVGKRLEFLHKTRNKVIKSLKGMDIIHPKGRGLNVAVKFRNEEEKKKLIDYCKSSGLEYTTCPRYIRVLDNAISIEIKRIE